MFKRVAMLAAVLALASPAVMADGIQFGYAGGAIGVVGTSTGIALTTTTNPIFEFVARIPNPPGPAYGGGVNMGTVNFTTGDYSGSAGLSNFFATGGSFTITGNSAFSAITGGAVANGATLFSGAFGDLTALTTLPSTLVVPAGTPAGTGAVWTSIACPPGQPAGASCSRLIAAINGTLDPALVAWLGLGNTNFASGWVAQMDFTVVGGTYTITFGDAALYVPEPGTLLLFGTGLAGIAGVLRRKIAA